MPTFEVTYQFQGKSRSVDVIAESEVEALQNSRVPETNTTRKAIVVERNPVIKYLQTGNGQQFINLLRQFENTMYAKVRKLSFFERYERVTGEKLFRTTPGILISEQEDKWGDELSIRFILGDFEPNFPCNATPRVYDGGKGILNDNEYLWALIEKHGFRFGK